MDMHPRNLPVDWTSIGSDLLVKMALEASVQRLLERDSTSTYWADVYIELQWAEVYSELQLPAGVKRAGGASLQYVKQGLGSSAHSVAIDVKQDRDKVQALDVLHHLGHNCQLQSLQLSSDCTSGIRLLNAAAALTSLTELKLIHFKVASGVFEAVRRLGARLTNIQHLCLFDIYGKKSRSCPQKASELAKSVYGELPTAFPRLAHLHMDNSLYPESFEWPVDIAQWAKLSKLRVLFLGMPTLTSLPATLSSPSRLERLDLCMHAQADLLPINHLTGLTDLCLELPGGTHLPDLDLSRHALQILHIFCGGPLEWNHGQMDDEFDPIHIGQRTLASLQCIETLSGLCLAGLHLGEVPAAVQNLCHLTWLDLSCNCLTAMPAGPYLARLEELNLSGNRFEAVPLEICGAAATLEILKLDWCHGMEVQRGAPEQLWCMQCLHTFSLVRSSEMFRSVSWSRRSLSKLGCALPHTCFEF